MNAEKLGRFIAQIRKEQNMTQLELAQKLQVTDKAISKWERGLGLPDINSIEPLADALGVTIIEIMRAERLPDEPISQENAAEAIRDTFDLAQYQRRQERKHMRLIMLGVLPVILLVFVTDTMGWMGMLGVVLPCICAALSISLIIYGIWRRKNRLPCMRTFIWAAVLAAVPASLALMLLIVGMLGLGPVPS